MRQYPHEVFQVAQDTASEESLSERILAKHDNAKWTVVTYLPFLWRPDEHMFLKPMVTQDFAERVGHPFVHDYSPALDPDVYASLLDLMAVTKAELGSGLNQHQKVMMAATKTPAM